MNQIRNRAANSAYVKTLDGSANAANYNVKPYNIIWTDKIAARAAVHLETRLELAMEGHRFFNLVRWGEADTVLNKYLTVEKTRRTHLTNAVFTKGKNEYFPIPQRYIDALPIGTVTQNKGF